MTEPHTTVQQHTDPAVSVAEADNAVNQPHLVTSQPDHPMAVFPDEEVIPEEHIHLPDPSIYPLILAIGITVALVGIPFKSVIIILLGVVGLAIGLGGWLLEDMRNAEHHPQGPHHH